MPASAPTNVRAAVTALPGPTFGVVKVPPPVTVTTSPETTPTSPVVVIEAALFAFYSLFTAVAPLTVRSFLVMFAVNPVGWVTVYPAAFAPPRA